MKPTLTRRYYRRSTPSRSETNFFKKESQHEQSFFGETSQGTFFQPAVAQTQNIHRKCEECEKEDKVQRVEDKKEEEKVMKMEDKKEEEKIQRQPEKKEEEKVMKMEDKKEEEKVQKKETSTAVSSGKAVSNYVSSLNGKGQPLSVNDNKFFSSRMGYDFNKVKIHTDKEAAESAKGINAKAYAVGNHVVFNEGQYNPHSSEGKKLMAHELTHVLQSQRFEKNSKLYRRGALVTPQAPVQIPAPTVWGTRGPISVQGANPQVPYAHNTADDSTDAMFARANRYDAIQKKKESLQLPWITTREGGEAPDFITEADRESYYESQNLGRIPYTRKYFHILGKIAYDFNSAKDVTQLVNVYKRYQSWMLSSKFRKADDPPFDPSVQLHFFMYTINPAEIDVQQIRNQIIASFQKRLAIIKEQQYKLNLTKVLTEAEALILKGNKRQEGPCYMKPVPRKGGNQVHDRFAEHVALIKGAFLTAVAEIQVTTPEGASYTFDVFNAATNQAFEVKTRHEWSGDMGLGSTFYWDDFIKRAVKLDHQRMMGLYVANRCGLEFRYVFDNCDAVLGMRKQWSNIPQIEYIPYPGTPKQNCT